MVWHPNLDGIRTNNSVANNEGPAAFGICIVLRRTGWGKTCCLLLKGLISKRFNRAEER